jgi:hypothetical protein
MATNRKPRIFQAPLKTMFLFEGNPIASLVTNKDGCHQETHMQFTKAETALAWCRQHGATLVYSPLNPQAN